MSLLVGSRPFGSFIPVMCCGKVIIGSVFVFYSLVIKVDEELKFSPMFLNEATRLTKCPRYKLTDSKDLYMPSLFFKILVS